MTGTLVLLSATGGLALLPGSLDAGQIAELQIQSESGLITAIVELLPPAIGASAIMRPFRFVALGDEDQERLASLVTKRRDKGYGIT